MDTNGAEECISWRGGKSVPLERCPRFRGDLICTFNCSVIQVSSVCVSARVCGEQEVDVPTSARWNSSLRLLDLPPEAADWGWGMGGLCAPSASNTSGSVSPVWPPPDRHTPCGANRLFPFPLPSGATRAKNA